MAAALSVDHLTEIFVVGNQYPALGERFQKEINAGTFFVMLHLVSGQPVGGISSSEMSA